MCLKSPALLLFLPFPQVASSKGTEAEYYEKKHQEHPGGSDDGGFDPRPCKLFLQLSFEQSVPPKTGTLCFSLPGCPVRTDGTGCVFRFR